MKKCSLQWRPLVHMNTNHFTIFQELQSFIFTRHEGHKNNYLTLTEMNLVHKKFLMAMRSKHLVENR